MQSVILGSIIHVSFINVLLFFLVVHPVELIEPKLLAPVISRYPRLSKCHRVHGAPAGQSKNDQLQSRSTTLEPAIHETITTLQAGFVALKTAHSVALDRTRESERRVRNSSLNE